MKKDFLRRLTSLTMFAIVLAACASAPKVTTLTPLSDSASVPYRNVLVLSLFESFDNRRYLEREVVRELKDRGVNAVAMTSLRDSRTKLSRELVLQSVEDINADAVLVTQLMNLQTTGKIKDARPEATYNLRPTYYYNVFSVELTEYVEPPLVEYSHDLALGTELFAADDQQMVWSIASRQKLVENSDRFADYSVFVDEASAIVAAMSRDRLIAK